VSHRTGTRWRRTRVAAVHYAANRGVGTSVVLLECGHVAFRQYPMAVGQRAYCAACREAA
jgi:hypothetical protein